MSADQLFAIILAAGRASRYGDVKQLARHAGESLVARAVRNAEKICGERTVLVTGHAGRQVHAACAPLRGFLVHNDDYDAGLAASLRCGVHAVSAAASGVLVMLADQPLVSSADLQRLVSLWGANPERAVASRYNAIEGVPAIFPRGDFTALRALSGDQGARAVLQRYGDTLPGIDLPAAAVDIDRPADLENLGSRY